MKRRDLYLALLLGLSVLSWAWVDLASYESVSKAAITATELREHVRYLASDELGGRGAGSKGAREARAYIATLFRRWGLKPMGDDGYFQTFSFTGRLKLGEGNELSLILPTGKKKSFTLGKEFLPLFLSANGEKEGELVFVGYGISAPKEGYDEYTSVDVKGKIVLALRGAPRDDPRLSRYATFRAKLRKAREKGAVAVLLFAGPYSRFPDEPYPLTPMRFGADSGIIGVTVKRSIAEALFDVATVQKRIDETRQPFSFPIPKTRVKIRVNLVRERAEDANVVGLLEGSDPQLKKEIIVVGAHYDHLGVRYRKGKRIVHNGADDNASGTAGLLELAQYFAANRHRIKRSLLFVAFGAEELGLIGSRSFVTDPPVPLDRIVAMINLDMIGRLRDDRLFLLGVGTSPLWKGLVEEANKPFKLRLRHSHLVFGGSDHMSFYLKRIPVLFFFTGLHPDYHRPSDDWQTLNYEGMERVTQLVALIIERIANLPQRPPFKALRLPAPRPRGPVRVTIGIIPDYAGEGIGVGILGVLPESPAAKAGLKGGDRIVAIAGKEIRNIYDLTDALAHLEPGKPVPFVILRGKKRLIVRVIPAARSGAQ